MTVAAVITLVLGLTSGIPAFAGVRATSPRAAHFPGQPDWPGPASLLRFRHWLFAAVLVTVGVVGLLVMKAPLPALILAVLGAAVPAAIAWRIGEYARACRGVNRAIAGYAPRIAMPYAGKVGVHIGMWSPWIDRTEIPWCIVAHNRDAFEQLAAMYETPIVQGSIPASVRGALYPHGAAKNAEFLRTPHVTHAFLGHGDSDKPLSASERVLDYELITVAGQAAIDRFESAGLSVPPAKLRIIGRPQTEGIQTGSGSSSSRVLYAPTWRHADDSLNVSSLAVADQIVQALLDRGCTVNFRRHFAGRNHAEAEAMIDRVWAMLEADAAATGREHGWGWSAVEQPLIEAFNKSDILVSDISGIVVDFMASLKPLVMYAAQYDSPGKFRTSHPSAQAAYIIDRHLTGLPAALDAALGDDPLAEQRRLRAEYYLGGPITVNPEQRFMDLVRELGQQTTDLPAKD